MIGHLSVLIEATSSGSEPTMRIGINSVEMSSISVVPISQLVSPMIGKGQAYYWSYAWQKGEQEARAELKAGETKDFDELATAQGIYPADDLAKLSADWPEDTDFESFLDAVRSVRD